MQHINVGENFQPFVQEAPRGSSYQSEADFKQECCHICFITGQCYALKFVDRGFQLLFGAAFLCYAEYSGSTANQGPGIISFPLSVIMK
jgi:hypothetical protein